jgi:membrane-associated phospholipid phosphatase
VFYSVTATVHRPRPPVVRMDVAPPTSSFPSRHTAAAVALYGCIAILVFWIYSRRPATRVAVVVLYCIPCRRRDVAALPGDALPERRARGGADGLPLVITTLLPRQVP